LPAVTLVRRALVAAVVALTGIGVWPAHGAVAASDPTAQAWYRGMLNDLHPLQSTLPGALNAASGWAAGSESAAAARHEFALDLPKLERVHLMLAKLAPLPGHSIARADYASAIGLYIASLEVDDAATELTPGALQSQLQHSQERIRELGDNVFDQGTAELAPLIGSNLAGDDVTAAAHLPDWSALGLAPQPPLASSWRAESSASPGSQARAKWATEVTMDGAPTQAGVRAALAGHQGPAQLAQMAVALGAADAFVSSIPGPAGDAQRSNRLRLGLLVDAEAVMAAESAHLGHGPPSQLLATVATSLVSIGGRLRAEG
jgi:hypothetical protein